MSIYDIREDFSYVFETSSIEYIKNYNFNPNTVTVLPLSMSNANSTKPITVDMDITEPWIQIIDPINGRNLKVPQGNVVLQPTSSQLVYITVNLPPEYDTVPDATIVKDIVLSIQTGSFPRANTRLPEVILPTATVSSNITSIRAGETVTYTVSTSNIPNNKVLYWKLRGTEVSATNFIDEKTDGTFTILNNSGRFTLTAKTPLNLEQSKYFILDIYLDIEAPVPTILTTTNAVALIGTSNRQPTGNPTLAGLFIPEITNYTIKIGDLEKRDVAVALYDNAGNLDTVTPINWIVEEGSANIKVTTPSTIRPPYGQYMVRTIEGLKQGTARIRLYAGIRTTVINFTIINK